MSAQNGQHRDAAAQPAGNDAVLAGLRKLHQHQLQQAHFTASLISTAEGTPSYQAWLKECADVLGTVPVMPADAAPDIWVVNKDRPERSLCRWVYASSVWIYDAADSIVATVLLAGIQSVHLTPADDGGGWQVASAETDSWCVQASAEKVLDAEQAVEFSVALQRAAEDLAERQPSLLPDDELAAARRRKGGR